MKIKQIPEDFLVEEIPTVKPKKTGPYAILELKKKDMDLINAKKAIAKFPLVKFNPSSSYIANITYSL